jgi:hypothetical protein
MAGLAERLHVRVTDANREIAPPPPAHARPPDGRQSGERPISGVVLIDEHGDAVARGWNGRSSTSLVDRSIRAQMGPAALASGAAVMPIAPSAPLIDAPIAIPARTPLIRIPRLTPPKPDARRDIDADLRPRSTPTVRTTPPCLRLGHGQSKSDAECQDESGDQCFHALQNARQPRIVPRSNVFYAPIMRRTSSARMPRIGVGRARRRRCRDVNSKSSAGPFLPRFCRGSRALLEWVEGTMATRPASHGRRGSCAPGSKLVLRSSVWLCGMPMCRKSFRRIT